MKEYTIKDLIAKFDIASTAIVASLDETFVDELCIFADHFRLLFGRKAFITSAFRTPAQNEKAGGVANSSHLKGLAVDIRCQSSAERYAILCAALICRFPRIGIGKSFVHIDMDESKPHPIIFTY